MSLDVVSLFTNVPVELAVIGVKRRWKFISKKTNIPRDEFVLALSFVLNSTFFKFNNIIYKQTFGSPMGSPLSPVMADIVLQDLEEKALLRLPLNLPIYFRYVDDIITAIPVEHIESILNVFNSFHSRKKNSP